MALSEIQLGIGLITGVNIQDILPCGFDPFSRYRDKLEYECLESIVHFIEDSLLASSPLIEIHKLPDRGRMVVG